MKKIIKGIALFLFFITLFLMLNSCASSCTKTRRYWNKHRCVEYSNPNVIKDERYGYS